MCQIYGRKLKILKLFTKNRNFSAMEGEEPLQKKIKLDSIQHKDIHVAQDPVSADVSNKTEYLVGMKFLLNRTTKISGIVKQRYSDFIVRECDLDGKSVHLTNLDHIDIDSPKQMTDYAEPPISKKEIDDIEKLIEIGDIDGKLTLSIDNDKEHRKIVHKYVKEKYKQLETGTTMLENEDRAILITFKKLKKDGRERFDRRNKNNKQCHFVLFKQNKDTMSCINDLARRIHVNPSLFTYAGTKDKRATTTQQVAVKNILSKQLSGLNKTLKQIAVGNFSYRERPLNLGDLSGNEFILVIRDIKEDDETVNQACESLKTNGFINYFGLQRFGTGAHPTHEIGKALLKGKIVDAVNMILTPRSSDADTPDFECDAKKQWQATKEPKKAMASIRSRSSLEAKLLQALSTENTKLYETEKCCKKAILTIPRNMRSLYLHSYQSLVWNNVVSQRIQMFGLKPVAGDLVLANVKDDNGYEQVYVLSEEDVKTEKHTMFDVVLPLPGFDMVYPDNLKTFYEDFMKNDELTFEQLRGNEKEFWLSGKYRKVLVRPKNTSWNVIQYDDHTIPLVTNDLEKIQNISVKNVATPATTGKYKGIVLSFTLPSSCYATSALREILADEVAYQAQMKLNKKSKQEDA